MNIPKTLRNIPSILFIISQVQVPVSILGVLKRRHLSVSAEELECHSTWKDGSLHYLVGRLSHAHATTDEERFRCFVFEFSDPFDRSAGLRMAQSGDATCNSIFSPTEGSLTLKMTRGE